MALLDLFSGYCKRSLIIVKTMTEEPTMPEERAAPEASEPASSSEASEPTAVETVPPPTAPKRKGRPPGSKDTVKRVRKPPVIVRVEPIASEPIAPERSVVNEPSTPRHKTKAPKLEPLTVRPAQAEIEDPPTPRSMLRDATRHFVALKSLALESSKAELKHMYTKKLSAWPD